MEEQESKSNWDELARELGAEVPIEVKQREEAVLAQPSSPAKPQPVVERAPLPKKAAGDWNELASELGLPPLPPEETLPAPAAPPKPQRPAAREEVRREPPRRDQEGDRPPRREQSRRDDSRREESRGSRGRRDERPPRAREDRADRAEHDDRGESEERTERGEREEPGNREDRGERRPRGGRGRGRGEGRSRSEGRRDDRGRRDRPAERDRGDQGERGERQRPPREFDADSEADREVRPATDEIREIEAELRSEPPVPVREEPPKPAAVSLWHKIFGSPAEQTAKLEDEPPRAEISRPLDERDEPRDAGSGFADVHSDEAFVEEREDAFESGEDRGAGREEGESSDRSRGRLRRRRGRGRGRGRGSDSRSEEGRSAEPRENDRPRRAERTERAEREDRFDDDEGDDDLAGDDLARAIEGDAGDDDEGDDAMAGAGASRRPGLQRAIPTWDEAIGYIVDSNMQTRSQRPRGPREGGGGGGRGRGRGRRKP